MHKNSFNLLKLSLDVGIICNFLMNHFMQKQLHGVGNMEF
jgi:hypothetical protein